MTLHRLPLCWFNNHTPNRREVKWDGLHYVGTCTCCGEAIRRKDKGEWKKDWNPSGLFKAA
jgi:hypothetical protein